MYVKISIISLFALLLIAGTSTPSIVFGEGDGQLSPDLEDSGFSRESTSCTLPDNLITFSVDKNLYQLGDEIKISGQVIPKSSTNAADTSKFFVYITIPKAKSIFIVPSDDRTENKTSSSVYDEQNASTMAQTTSLSILDATAQIDECGNFNATIDVIPLVFKNGFYVLNVKYLNEEVQEDIFILDEDLQKGCFETNSYLSESGRCGDFKGDDSDIEISAAPMPEIILEFQKDEYLPGEHVRISGQIKNAIFNDSIELAIESPSTSDDGNEVNIITKSINLRGTEPTFYWKYDIASGADGIGTYSVSAQTHLGLTSKTFIVNDESIVTEFAAQKSLDKTSTKKIIDKFNRITDSEILISLDEKASEDQTLLPRVIQGSLFTAARGDESSINIQISSSSGQCIIGQDSNCAVNDSTRKIDSIYDLIQIDGKNYNVRYTGPDVRLEKFTIVPEISNTEIETKNWNVTIMKDDQPTKFYYKVSYVSFE